VVAVGLIAALIAGIAGTAVARGARSSAVGIHTYSTGSTLPLRTALFDPYSFVGNSDTAYSMARAAGVSYVRLPINWRSVAPNPRPAESVASDPASPGYSWTDLDDTVVAAETAGLTPILDIVAPPPKWAFAVLPQGNKAGTPQVSALGQFAKALATHYNGENGPPAVRTFEVWNEPNLTLQLSPVKPAVFRSMVNAVAAAVHAVDPRNLVVAGDLDPFENQAPRFVAQAPLAFMRAMLCVSKGAHPHATCKTAVHFDVWSHHPYTFNGPFGHARRTDDVSLGDLPKMRALLQAAVKLHHVVSSHPVQFWVTEFSWDTNPPRPHGVPLTLQGRWTAESLYQMWRSGVSLATWFQLQDLPSPNPYQSGLYFHAKSLAKAKPKPTLTALSFPFVAYLGKKTASVWGRDPTSKKMLITVQLAPRQGGPWRTVAKIGSNRYGIFKAHLKLKATKKNWLRATVPGSTAKSLAFSLTVPKNVRHGPWGN